jgi:hypothetical protein
MSPGGRCKGLKLDKFDIHRSALSFSRKYAPRPSNQRVLVQFKLNYMPGEFQINSQAYGFACRFSQWSAHRRCADRRPVMAGALSGKCA